MKTMAAGRGSRPEAGFYTDNPELFVSADGYVGVGGGVVGGGVVGGGVVCGGVVGGGVVGGGVVGLDTVGDPDAERFAGAVGGVEACEDEVAGNKSAG